jgi:hypothetical protein
MKQYTVNATVTPLDGGSVRRRAATYTQDSTNTE